jgi:hypothetical protein
MLVEGGPVVERVEGAVVPKNRRPAELQVDVAGTAFDRVQKEGVEIHAAQHASAMTAERFTPNEGVRGAFGSFGSAPERGLTQWILRASFA